MSQPIVIAVDGTAASGKGTLAKKLARHFGFAHMDSGVLYRLTALATVEAGGDPTSEVDALKGARAIDLSRASDPTIRSAKIGQLSSIVSPFPAVREALKDFQRSFLAHPPGNSPGAVMDGRDIGTVIAPDATAKLFVDAKPEIRAHRRWMELKSYGAAPDEAAILRELNERDTRDSTRAVSPQMPAADASLLDTSDLDIDAAFVAALALVRPKVEPKLQEMLKAQPKG